MSCNFTGPPLLAIPSFALFGSLKTTRPNRDPFFASLPVEVLSGRFKNNENNEEMKRSAWRLHVPTALQDKVLAAAASAEYVPIEKESLAEAYSRPQETVDLEDVAATESPTDSPAAVLPVLVSGPDGQVRSINPGVATEPDEMDEVDYAVGYENLNLIRAVTRGAKRGLFEPDLDEWKEFEALEEKSYRYVISPKRLIAAVDIKGDVDTPKISKALKDIEESGLFKSSSSSNGLRYRPKRVKDVSFGLQLWGTKACFNTKAEPAMAIYEIQYDKRVTTVFIEIEECS